jgi:hypothetical protein
MHDDQLKLANHNTIRKVLRVGGPAILLTGLALMAISLISFISAFGGMDPPRFFWGFFVGIPLVFVGGVMCQIGYMADVARYIAAETSPVAKDTANYMGEGVQPGAKAVAKAITEGVLEAQREHRADS